MLLLRQPVADMRPRLLDLFCGAGGAAMGYHRAGFDVVGVDIRPQPRYPFEFHQADALTFPLEGFDAIHASPPCQDHSSLKVNGLHGTGWMLDSTRQRLTASPALWIIENVVGADMRADFLLCGGMFGLRTYRHRRFELDPRFPGLLGVPSHPLHVIKSSRGKRRSHWNQGYHMTVTGHIDQEVAAACLDIDWMTSEELVQAIPPAYTHFIGGELIEWL